MATEELNKKKRNGIFSLLFLTQDEPEEFSKDFCILMNVINYSKEFRAQVFNESVQIFISVHLPGSVRAISSSIIV